MPVSHRAARGKRPVDLDTVVRSDGTAIGDDAAWADRLDQPVFGMGQGGQPLGQRLGLRLVRRPGESTRCLMYCYAAPFCDQWAEIQSAGRGADLTSA